MKTIYTLEIYKDRKKEFRFRMRHKNGKIILESSESYKRKATMKRVMFNAFFEIQFGDYETIDLTLKK